MKKILLISILILIMFNLTGCKNKGDITEVKLVEVECVADEYIKFKNDYNQYEFNETWFDDLNVSNRIKKDKIYNGDIVRVRFSYYGYWSEDNIKDYEIIKKLPNKF